MKKIASLILYGIFFLLFSCIYICCKDRQEYHIDEEKRISRKYIGGDFPLEEMHYEYFFVNNGKRSAVVVGFVAISKKTVVISLSGNSQAKEELTFPVDDKMEIDLLDYALSKIKANKEFGDVKCLELSMKVCGIANLNIGKSYWKKRESEIEYFQQPLFHQIRETLRNYGYDIYNVSNDDFYPIAARDLRYYHTLPESCSLDASGIDGYVILKCKKLTNK